MAQDFSKKIAIVARQDIAIWQVMNAVAHISAYMGNKMQESFDTGEYFITKDGKNHPRNSQYAIIVLDGTAEDLQNLMQEVRKTNLLFHGFIREMIETTDDEEITTILSKKADNEIEYLGVGMFGIKEEVDALTKKFSLWKVK